MLTSSSSSVLLTLEHFFEPARILPCSPTDGPQNNQAKPRIIQGPRVMPKNAAKDAAISFLVCPHDRPLLSFPLGGGEHLDFVCITNHRPVWLVQKMKFTGHPAKDRVIRRRDHLEIDR